jgi:hypothetical protein
MYGSPTPTSSTRLSPLRSEPHLQNACTSNVTHAKICLTCPACLNNSGLTTIEHRFITRLSNIAHFHSKGSIYSTLQVNEQTPLVWITLYVSVRYDLVLNSIQPLPPCERRGITGNLHICYSEFQSITTQSKLCVRN